MNKLSAFTILEVTVSMLIASVSIVIAYTAYIIISKSYREYETRNMNIYELALADKQLRCDFLEAKKITRSDEGIVLQDTAGLINYTFRDSYILRDQHGLHTDTLYLAVTGFHQSFEGTESNIGDPVDKLHINLITQGRNNALTYFKLYSAEDLLN